MCPNRSNLNRYCVSSRQDSKHRIQDLQRPGGPEEEEEEEKDEECRKNPNHDEGNGALPDSAFAGARSATWTDRTGNGRSSIKSDQGQREGGGCRTEGPLELRKEPRRSRTSRGTVFTTLHLLPKTAGEQCRPIASSLPRLLTGQQAQSRVLAEAQKVSVNGSNSHRIIPVCLQNKSTMIIWLLKYRNSFWAKSQSFYYEKLWTWVLRSCRLISTHLECSLKTSTALGKKSKSKWSRFVTGVWSMGGYICL